MRIALLLCLAAGLAACDASGSESFTLPETVSGTVVSLSTGQPLPGLAVDLRTSLGFGATQFYDQTTTDADGRFTLRPNQRDVRAELHVNGRFDTYNPSVYEWSSLGMGEPIRSEMQVEVWEIAELVVYATTDTPLGPDDRAFVGTPCIGSVFVPVRAGCAKANAENEVTLTVTRGGETTTRTEQIYTPLDETTVVRWTY